MSAEPRHLVRLRIKVSGTDERGNPFAQTAFTHDVSMRGARVTQVPPFLCPATVVDLEYRGRRSPFRVVWVGVLGNEVGLLSLEPSRRIWGSPLPGPVIRSTSIMPAALDLTVNSRPAMTHQASRLEPIAATLQEKRKRVGYFCKDSACHKTHTFHMLADDRVVWDIWPQKMECPVSGLRHDYWKEEIKSAGYA
jgi:hypothetical protein